MTYRQTNLYKLQVAAPLASIQRGIQVAKRWPKTFTGHIINHEIALIRSSPSVACEFLIDEQKELLT